MDHKKHITTYIAECRQVFDQLGEQIPLVEKMAELLVTAYKAGHKAVLFGNGGSAGDAQHIAAELLGGFESHERKSFPALALTTNTSTLTAVGNDYGYDAIFSRQVEAMVNPGDVVIAISTSGNSSNVLKGILAAKKQGATVIGLTGQTGGKMKTDCDLVFCIPSSKTSHVQEAHISIGHILCGILEQELS